MKEIFFAGCLITAGTVYSQTNTFPTTGNAGIGTLTPSGKFEINFTGNPAPTATFFRIIGTDNSSSGNELRLFEFNDPNAQYFKISRPAWSGAKRSPIVIGTGSGAFVSLNSEDPNVGIGETNPNARLQVYDAGPAADAIELFSMKASYSNNLASKAMTWRDVSNITGQIDTRFDGTYTNMVFGHLYNGGYQTSDVMTMRGNGNVGIGTSTPTQKLDVNGNARINGNGNFNGTVIAKKIQVSQSAWADHVFDKQYKLRSLSTLEYFIKANKHLPEVPSAKEVEENGISVGDNQALLLKKIEELTLYLIEMNRKNRELEIRLKVVEKNGRLLRK